MRKALSLVIIAVIGLMLGGCTGAFNTAYIKKNEVLTPSTFDVKITQKQKVGNRNIKFYVDDIKDNRKYKGIVLGKGAFSLNYNHIFSALKDFDGTIKAVTKKALYETGWSITEIKDNATYIVSIDVEKLSYRMRFADFLYTSDIRVCVYNPKKNRLIIAGEPKSFHRLISPIDINLRKGGAVSKLLRYLYKSLINFFSSKAFVDAIENGRQHIDSSVDCSFALDNSTE